MMLDGGL